MRSSSHSDFLMAAMGRKLPFAPQSKGMRRSRLKAGMTGWGCLSLSAAGAAAGAARAAVEAALGLTAVGPVAGAAFAGLRLPLAAFRTAIGPRFAVRFRTV